MAGRMPASMPRICCRIAGLTGMIPVVDVDPYDGYIDLARTALKSALPKARRAKDNVAMRDIAEASIAHVEESLFELAGKTWSVRNEFERDLGEDDEVAFRSLDSMTGFLFATAKFLEHDERAAVITPPVPIAYVVSALNVRATSVAHEICAMLRAGFPIGAHARWRTLYEIDVIAHVLLKGNRGTAARFVNHRWIQLARDNHRTGAEWREPGPSVEAMKNKFIRRYGRPFAGTHGWAAEIAKRMLGVEKPNLSHLEQIANLDGHNRRVYAAHHGIHADSLGILQLIDEDGIFHSGARVYGIAAGCLQTIRVLGEINDATLAIWNRHARSSTTNLMRYLNDELNLVLQEDVIRHMRTVRYSSSPEASALAQDWPEED